MNVYDIDPDTLGLFDIVFFFGVYYHLKHPILALERIATVTREFALIESEVTAIPPEPAGVRGVFAQIAQRALPPAYSPAAGLSRFYEQDTLGGDPTNWWVPDLSTLASTVRAAGFPRVEIVTRYHDRRGIVRAYKGPRTAGKALVEDFFVHIDKLPDNIPAHSPMPIQGWALSQLEPATGIDEVFLYLDHLDNPAAQLGKAEYPTARPDLTRPFIDAYGQTGFQFTWDTTGITPGRHTLYALAVGKRGWHYRAMRVTIV